MLLFLKEVIAVSRKKKTGMISWNFGPKFNNSTEMVQNLGLSLFFFFGVWGVEGTASFVSLTVPKNLSRNKPNIVIMT